MLADQPKNSSRIDSSHFSSRHIGLNYEDQDHILHILGNTNLDEFISELIPDEILDKEDKLLSLSHGCSEDKALNELSKIAKENKIYRSLIGLGYHGTILPEVIKRHVLENPSWYTAYTPYQSEISQGRLEALFNFQTLISELTGFPIANASLLDEATAAAEAMSLSLSISKSNKATPSCFYVDQDVLPQTLDVLKTRAQPLGITLEIGNPKDFVFCEESFGLLLQLPGSSGRVWDPSLVIDAAHAKGALVTVAIDPLAQVLIEPVAQFGADIAIGSVQRFGIPMAFGGPHAAFFATKDTFKRQIPGRLVGQSLDADGQPALRLALQTREQHIRRDKATSNICTSQVLLAVIASFYAVYHGPEGLENIAKKIINLRLKFEYHLSQLGYSFASFDRFDTIEVFCKESQTIHKLAALEKINLRILPLGSSIEDSTGFGITFDELSTDEELYSILHLLANAIGKTYESLAYDKYKSKSLVFNEIKFRSSAWLTQKTFNSYRSETEIMRYIYSLAKKDFSLTNGMIPLGSCTMKLNSSSELAPISWPEISNLHPLAPLNQARGFKRLVEDLEKWLATITGFAGVSLQPNAGSQGEFAGLLVIKAWHKSLKQDHRDICLIPTSAHGTNPASSIMAGMKVVPVNCNEIGNIDFDDLSKKVELHSHKLAALMITYPSTHGVFEPNISDVCELVHKNGGQVYLDGANLNAQVGLCRPGCYGPDVCHINLHKTFCIPHGGGGPGVGPIAVATHLVPYLPNHSFLEAISNAAIGPVSAAPFGSAGILPISWMYIRMMGSKGLRRASSVAILSANYIAHQLKSFYPILYAGQNGLVAHECILDLRPLKKKTGIGVEDIAKRLMDYGFHAPTVSWPVAGTLMVEPTESESLKELNRFCDAMIAIHAEVEQIHLGEIDPINNPLRRAPHTMIAVTSDAWDRPYSRQQAAFPSDHQLKDKFWPAVSRIDNALGDRQLICSCSTF